MNVPAKFISTFSKNLKKYHTIINKYKKDGVNETETVKVINDILAELFGYDKYNEITSEYAINHTYCDLAIKNSSKNDKIYMLIEVKGVAISLTDRHIDQAVDYGIRANVKWVILTNAEVWKVYKIKGNKKETVFEFNLLKLNPKDKKQLEQVYAISKQGKDKSVIEEIYSNNQINNKYVIAAILNSPETYKSIRNVIRRHLDKSVKITEDDIENYMKNDIIRRDVIDSDEAIEAQKYVKQKMKTSQRK